MKDRGNIYISSCKLRNFLVHTECSQEELCS